MVVCVSREKLNVVDDDQLIYPDDLKMELDVIIYSANAITNMLDNASIVVKE